MFTFEEKLILIQAVQEKSWLPEWQAEFNRIIEKGLEPVETILWRGLTNHDAEKLHWITKDSVFGFGQATSFTSDETVANEFCGMWAQETYTVIELEIDKAFPLHIHVDDIIFTAEPELKEALLEGSNRTWESFVDSLTFDLFREREWLIPKDTMMKVHDVISQDVENWYFKSKVVYN